MAGRKDKPKDLREACLREALAIIDAEGVEKLSLREVARRVGVSHQAPYKHFSSRDHILAEIVARAFESFAQYLDQRPRAGNAHEDLMGMARDYLSYAAAHPLQYRLMFGTPLPDTEAHPRMMEQARHAFSLLSDGLRRLTPGPEGAGAEDGVLLDAVFIWSALHGFSGISGGGAMKGLRIPQAVADKAAPYLLAQLSDALERRGGDR